MANKEYTLENFQFEKVICEESGSWQHSIFGTEKEWSINLSSILTRLIKLAGKICDSYASDLFIDWNIVERNLKNYEFDGGKFLFGFRTMGVDGNTYVLSRLNNYGKEGMKAEIKELYMVEFSVEKHSDMWENLGDIRCKFGKAKVVEN